MRVVDVDGQFIGFVREIRDQRLIVNRPSVDDLQVPLSVCEIKADQVKLSVPEHNMAARGWILLGTAGTT